jgi:hypothetical protein
MSKIRIKHLEHEIELEGDDGFIDKHLDGFYKKINISNRKPRESSLNEKPEEVFKPVSPTKDITPAEFFKKFTQKNKTEGVNQILIFGKYMEEIRAKTEFTVKEINQIVREAKLSKDIHRQFFTNAVKQGLLRSSGKGSYSLTLSAETAYASMQ